jgi:hypothetical protein
VKACNDRVSQEYLQNLERLERLLEDQSECIMNGDWDSLPHIMGKIENAQVALNMTWQEIASDDGVRFLEMHINDEKTGDKARATGMLRKILSKKTENERMILDELNHLKKGIVKLRETRNNHKSYLAQN